LKIYIITTPKEDIYLILHIHTRSSAEAPQAFSNNSMIIENYLPIISMVLMLLAS